MMHRTDTDTARDLDIRHAQACERVSLLESARIAASIALETTRKAMMGAKRNRDEKAAAARIAAVTYDAVLVALDTAQTELDAADKAWRDHMARAAYDARAPWQKVVCRNTLTNTGDAGDE